MILIWTGAEERTVGGLLLRPGAPLRLSQTELEVLERALGEDAKLLYREPLENRPLILRRAAWL